MKYLAFAALVMLAACGHPYQLAPHPPPDLTSPTVTRGADALRPAGWESYCADPARRVVGETRC